MTSLQFRNIGTFEGERKRMAAARALDHELRRASRAEAAARRAIVKDVAALAAVIVFLIAFNLWIGAI